MNRQSVIPASVLSCVGDSVPQDGAVVAVRRGTIYLRGRPIGAIVGKSCFPKAVLRREGSLWAVEVNHARSKTLFPASPFGL